MNNLDKIVSDLVGYKLVYILSEGDKFILRLSNGPNTKILTVSAEPVDSDHARPALEYKDLKHFADS